MRLTRREFSAFIGWSGLAGFPRSASAHPNGLVGRFPAIVDASMHTTGQAAYLKSIGVKVVIRYYSRWQPALPQKILEQPEADVILNCGLSLGISFQYNNNLISSFTAERARLDVNTCVQKVAEFGQPKGSAIYFGVDGDFTSPADVAHITEYFEILNGETSKRGSPFEIGVYGSGYSCMYLRDKGLAKFFWIAGLSDGWSGRAEFLATGAWNMYQNVLEVPVGGSVLVDTNVVNPKRSAIGSFRRSSGSGSSVLDGAVEDPKSVEVQRIVIRDTFYTDIGSRKKRLLRASKMVLLVRDEGNLSSIDVPRQIGHGNATRADFVRGRCRTSDLAQIT